MSNRNRTALILMNGHYRDTCLSKDVALRAMNAIGPVLYAIRTRDRLIKIGCSADLATRRRKFTQPHEVLAVAFGSFAEERAIHDRLTDYHRARGRELYYPTLEVLAIVNEMRLAMDLPALER